MRVWEGDRNLWQLLLQYDRALWLGCVVHTAGTCVGLARLDSPVYRLFTVYIYIYSCTGPTWLMFRRGVTAGNTARKQMTGMQVNVKVLLPGMQHKNGGGDVPRRC